MILTGGLGFGGGLAARGYGAWIGAIAIPDAETESGGGFDAPYREYVKRINAERASDWQRSQHQAGDDQAPIASPDGLDYDARVGQGAPAAGASRSLDVVAPTLLQDAERSIVLTKQALGVITRTAAMTARQRLDDEAAMLALFALMMDDD